MSILDRILDRIQDSFKFLDKNGLKHLVEKIKTHDVHWAGTHAEYEAVKDTIPDYAILHFTDDYDEANSIYKKSFTMYREDGVTPGGTCHALKFGPLVVLRIQGFVSVHNDNGKGYIVMPANTLPVPVTGTANCHSTMHASLTNSVVCTAFVTAGGALNCESAAVADKSMFGEITYYTVDESYDYSSWTKVVN